MDEGVQLLELARNAQRLFAKQEPCEKRRLLNFLLSHCTWEDGEVVATFRQPFDLLAETAVAAARTGAGETAKTAETEIWRASAPPFPSILPREVSLWPTSRLTS
jgi:site-specific DNA recombinase